MQQRSRLIVNSAFNVSARAVTIVSRFIIVPFAVAVLGRSHYGIWAVVGQIFAYSRILDMGLRSAVSREVALGLASGDHATMNRQINSAAGYYLAAGALVMTAAAGISVFFPGWFDVPSDMSAASRVMVLCSALGVACSIGMSGYAAVLVGMQRYDIVSGAQVLADLLRLALILLLLRQFSAGGGLIVLAASSGGTTAVAAILSALMALRLCAPIRFEPWRVDRTVLRGLMAFGVNSVIYMMAIGVGCQLAQIVVGAVIGTADAADFNVAMLFLLAAHAFVIAFGISTRVVASRYDGEARGDMIRKLLLRSTRYSGLFVLAGVVAIWLYSDSLFSLWIGDEYGGVEGTAALARVGRTCRILLIGYGLFWLSMPGYNVLNGMGRHRFPAVVAGAAGLASMVLVTILALLPDASIHRVAWGVVVPAIPVWGLVLPWYCCRETGQPIGQYVWHGFAIPLLGCVPAGIIGFLCTRFWPATNWLTLIGQLAGCGCVLLLVAWFGVFAADDRAHLKSAVRGVLARRNSSQ